MIARLTTMFSALLFASTAMAEDCPADFDFVAPQGHDGRAQALKTLGTMFKAGKEKDEAAFLATAADPYIQHSPDLPDGMQPVFDLLVNRPEGFSSKQMPWLGEKGFLDNGNYLVMFREVNRADGTPPSKIFDLMRFDSEGKYAEHWDMRQKLSDTEISGRSETAAAEEFMNDPVEYDQATEEANRRLVAAFLNLAFNANRLETAIDLYIGANFVASGRANPLTADGVKPVLDVFKSKNMPPLCYDVRFILAQNDLVWVYSKVTSADDVDAVADLFRVRDGRIVEYWDVVQSVPDTMPHDNGMF